MFHRKKIIGKLMLPIIVFFIMIPGGPCLGGEISSAAQYVMSGNVDPVMAARVNSQTILYEVEEGDTLWDISRKYNVDWELIAAMNDLRDTYLNAGQLLILPVIEPVEEYQETYSVKAGDTLTKIACQFNVPLQSLIASNNLRNPNILLVGQKLKIPSGEAVSVFKSHERDIVSRSGFLNLRWPVKGRITSYFGPRGGSFHYGLDIAAPSGTPVRSVDSGKVIFSGWKNNIYGYTVILEHSNGNRTMYAHNKVNVVNQGEMVKSGQIIARVGATGNATGCHLHFAVFKDEKPIDPLKCLRK